MVTSDLGTRPGQRTQMQKKWKRGQTEVYCEVYCVLIQPKSEYLLRVPFRKECYGHLHLGSISAPSPHIRTWCRNLPPNSKFLHVRVALHHNDRLPPRQKHGFPRQCVQPMRLTQLMLFTHFIQ